MFKKASLEEEICRSMESKLISNQSEIRYGFSKLAKAVDFLHAATEIFEQAGMTEQANEVTEVLQDLATQLSKKTSFASTKRKTVEQCMQDEIDGWGKCLGYDLKENVIGNVETACPRCLQEYEKKLSANKDKDKTKLEKELHIWNKLQKMR